MHTLAGIQQMMAQQSCLATMRMLQKMIDEVGPDSVKATEIKKIVSDIGDIRTRIERLYNV